MKLTRTQRAALQRQLTLLGYDAGVADGLWGAKTRAAIRSWQKANRRTQTGYVTAAQVKLIGRPGRKVAPPPPPTRRRWRSSSCSCRSRNAPTCRPG